MSDMPTGSNLNSTPALSRDGFSFNDGRFYVEDDPHRHSRKNAVELYGLLTYTSPPPLPDDATNESKRRLKDTHKDPKADFYSAQLAHYGLKVLKTRDAAKKKLLAAFSREHGGAMTLSVPSAILELEAALKKEWQAADKASKVKRKAPQNDPAVEGKRRKVAPKFKSESSGNSALDTFGAVAMSLGSSAKLNHSKAEMWIRIKDLSPAHARNLLIKMLDTVPEVEAPLSAELSKIPRTKQTPSMIVDIGTSFMNATPYIPPPQEPSRPYTKQTARKSSGVSAQFVPGASYAATLLPNSKPARTKQTAIKSSGKTSGYTMNVADPSRPPRMKQAARKGIGYRVDGLPLAVHEWVGEYLVRSYKLAENWPEMSSGGELHFGVYPSSTSRHFWASFDFGIVSGVMRSIGPLPSIVGGRVFVEWRGREANEGTLLFSKYNRGILRFFGNGNVEGNMRGETFGQFYFGGAFDRDTPKTSSMDQIREVRVCKGEWRSINSTNYEVARISRWGKWGGEEEDESAYESDTTDGHHEMEAEPNFDEFEPDSEWDAFPVDTDEEDY